MSTLTFRSVKNIGYNPPVGVNVDTSEYCKFDVKEIELEDNEIGPPSEDECDQEVSDEEEYAETECMLTTDDSCSEVSEDCDFPAIIKKRKRVVEKVYSMILQEEEFLPE